MLKCIKFYLYFIFFSISNNSIIEKPILFVLSQYKLPACRYYHYIQQCGVKLKKKYDLEIHTLTNSFVTLSMPITTRLITLTFKWMQKFNDFIIIYFANRDFQLIIILSQVIGVQSGQASSGRVGLFRQKGKNKPNICSLE